MKKKRILIYIISAVIVFFGLQKIFKPKIVFAPERQIKTEETFVAPTSSTPLEQKAEPAEVKMKQAGPVIVLEEKPIEIAATGKTDKANIILLDVPFTSQAPLAEWADKRQQDGCEEASALMAVRWARGLGPLTKAEAKKEIFAIADFEEKNYQNYIDTAAIDTLKIIINEYFGYRNVLLKENATIEEIISELAKGNTLILPMDGKKLRNPNFTNGGPDRHNIVIRGYDPYKKEFITNDPGTRKGEGYRYAEKVIDSAWRDYVTGDHLPIDGIKKNMIIVYPLK